MASLNRKIPAAVNRTCAIDNRSLEVVIPDYGEVIDRHRVFISNLPWGSRDFSYELLSIGTDRNLETL